MNNFDFFSENIDYFRFLIGITYFFLGLIAIGVLINFKKTLRPYFVLFAFLISSYYLIGIFLPYFGTNPFFTPIRLLFLLAANVFLIESGRRMLRLSGIKWLGFWIYIPLIIVFLWGISPNMLVNEAIIIYVFTIPGYFLVSLGVFRFSAKYKKQIRILFLSLSVVILLFGVLNLFVPPKTNLIFSSFFNQHFFISTFQMPVEIVLFVVLNLVLFLNFHMYVQATQQFLNVGILKFKAYGLYFFYALFLLAIISGWIFTNRFTYKETLRMNKEFLTNSRLVANAINIERINNLKGNDSDLVNDDYLRIKHQIFLVRKANEEFRFIYVNRMINDSVVLLVDSEDPASVDYSPPGQRLDEATDVMKSVFYTGKEAVDGPYTDKWGTWMSAYVPIYDKNSRQTNCILGIDISASDWLVKLVKARVVSLTIIAIVMVLLLVFIAFYQQNKLQEIRLSASEKRYKSLFENIRDAAIVVNLGDMTIAEVNRQAEILLKYTREEIIGLPIANYVVEKEDLNFSQMVFQDGLINPNTLENRIIDSKGSLIFVDINSGYLFINGEKYLIAILRDITERKQNEIELKRSKDRAELLFQMVPSAIFTVDNDRIITSWNENAEKITGYSAQEALGKPCSLFAEEYCEEKCGLFTKQIKPIMHRECFIKTKEGGVRHILKNVDFLKDHDGNVFGGIESFEDITEIKNTQLELIRAKKAAEAASLAKSEFLANMSHEIRTPINGVVGLTDLLLNSSLSKLQIDYLENIKFSAFSLLDIINGILDFSKIEAGKVKLENETVDIILLIESAVKMFSGRIDNHKIELLCRIESNVPRFIRGDEVKIRQILINFLSNAVKFTENGEILVKLALHNDNQISLSVKDSGIGIKPGELNLIFEKFIQADSSSTRLYGGTGLGLSISKSLAEMMHGNIEVVSQFGSGSEFTLLFPFEPALKKEVVADLPPGIKKVLLVDDNATNLSIMHDMLQRFHIDAVTVDNVADALRHISAKEAFDAVILDFQMPHTDALTFAELIRKTDLEKQPLIILMLTNLNAESLHDETQYLGITQFLLKPVTMSQLYDTFLTVSTSPLFEKKISTTNHTFTFQPKGKSILVAEDQRINLMVIQNRLENMGFTVQVATNGKEAIEQFAGQKPDLIIMDVHMPVMDGYEATTQIRLLENGRTHIPIIALSADTLFDTMDKCFSCGMDDYISKPFKPSELFEKLNKYLT